MNHRQFTEWTWEVDRYADECLSDGPDMEKVDRHFNGTGSHWGPPMPQRQATSAEAKNLETGWQRLLAKHRKIIAESEKCH